ncbi:MAG TPA: ROK family protein [Steroidobacteraceae bacterium]|jgi:fructokinase|nr:ROK family protein [Steroidobacteraceae bacterium]
MSGPKPLLCGVELGGTKCECLLGTDPTDVRARSTIDTGRDAGVTLGRIAALLEQWRAVHGEFAALGIASFGPLELRREAQAYGRIGLTPKEGWSQVDVAGFFARRFGRPLGLTTDVIAAALAEGRWGAARGLTDYVYVTVGTGIGCGVIAAGRPLLGARHPELGHIRVARAPGDAWPGVCRFHGDCVEGLASGPAIEARSGSAPAQLRADDPVWETVAHALAQLVHTLVLALAPQRIVMGGGVLGAQPHLLQRIRSAASASLNAYPDPGWIGSGLAQYLVPPGLGTLAGPLGALAVAADTCTAIAVSI